MVESFQEISPNDVYINIKIADFQPDKFWIYS